jgi:hypothetical protein
VTLRNLKLRKIIISYMRVWPWPQKSNPKCRKILNQDCTYKTLSRISLYFLGTSKNYMLALMHDLQVADVFLFEDVFSTKPMFTNHCSWPLWNRQQRVVWCWTRCCLALWQVFTHVCYIAELVKIQCRGLVWTKYLDLSLGLLYSKHVVGTILVLDKIRQLSAFWKLKLLLRGLCIQEMQRSQ